MDGARAARGVCARISSRSGQLRQRLERTVMPISRLVTVVIPCYNNGSFLHDAIRSVLSQTYQRTELIVVDDGSSDDTSGVASSYPGIRVIRQNNQGVSAARNAGLGQSRGDYVVFLDADDRLLPDAVDVGVRCLESHPACAFASGQVRLAAQDGSILRIPDDPCIEKDHYLTLLQYCYIYTLSAVMFRTAVLKSVGGFTVTLSGAADWDLYLRISRRLAVLCHSHLVAEYRLHDKSMSTNSALMLTDCLAALRAQRESFKGLKDCEDAYRIGVKGVQRFYGDPLVETVKRHARASEWIQAMIGVLVLLRYCPARLVRHSSSSLLPS
jgi:glycosyltransferase involved in cell wall biosynthesis